LALVANRKLTGGQVVQVQQLPRLSQILGSERLYVERNGDPLQGWREWSGAIAALPCLLQSTTQGLIFSSPAPVLKTAQGQQNLTSVVFTPTLEVNEPSKNRYRQLPRGGVPLNPVSGEGRTQTSFQMQEVPLSPQDPLQNEQFCLLLTPEFSLLIVLTLTADGGAEFDFSFDPEVTEQAWQVLRSRIQINSPQHLGAIEQTWKQFPLRAPHYHLVSTFTRQLLNHLRPPAPTQEHGTSPTPISPDVELLQALTHEVRTPLTTIRMLTRLLLKRKDLSADVLKRLRVIDQECTEQINRMELIFQATELEGKNESQQGVNLTPIPLEELFSQSIPYWKKQAKRRNVELEVMLPEKLPTVISHPKLLTQVLTGLMENFTARLPTGGKMNVQVMTVGNQIKLQLLSQNLQASVTNKGQEKSIGQLLTLQPETGNLSLNLNVTKNLFQALGGKLTVRQREETGEVLTVFLPVSIINR